MDERDFATLSMERAFHPLYIYRCLSQDFARLHDKIRSIRSQPKYPVVEYINEHYSESISLESLASVFGITPAYLSAYFKKTVGINLATYLSSVRMRAAHQIMEKRPGIKNSELAELLGFTNTTTFIRQFRSYYGTTPEKYKQGYSAPDSGP